MKNLGQNRKRTISLTWEQQQRNLENAYFPYKAFW